LLVWTLIALLVLLGLGAVAGGGALLLGPDGAILRMPLSLLSGTPFRDFRLPGLLLFLFNGVYPLAVARWLWRPPNWRWPQAVNPFPTLHWVWTATLVAGVILTAWITVQIRLLGYLHPIQLVYLGWGVLIAALTLAPGVRASCSTNPTRGPEDQGRARETP
jgi:hypothetical protein